MTVEMEKAILNENEMRILNTIRARQILRHEDIYRIDSLAADIIDDKRINLERGSLGLAKATAAKKTTEEIDMWALATGENKMGEMDEKPAATSTEEIEVAA